RPSRRRLARRGREAGRSRGGARGVRSAAHRWRGVGREGRGRCRSYRRRSRDGQNGGYARESGRETRRPASACSERTSAHERRGRGGRRQRGKRPGSVAAGGGGLAGQQQLGTSAVVGRYRQVGNSVL